jgi:uncharacterized membrane protein
VLQDLLTWLGYGLCHQLPERSFFGGGVQVPVCARDTGIYLGFVIAFALIAVVHRGERPREFPSVRVWIVMGVFLAAMGFDGISSYAGLRETTNSLRLITGIGVGFSAAAMVFPMLQDELWRRPGVGRVLDPAWRLATWLAAVPISFVIVLLAGPLLGVAYPLLVAASILFTLCAINLVIVAMLPAFDRKGERLSDVIVPASVALVVALVEIAAAGYVRLLAEGVARG